MRIHPAVYGALTGCIVLSPAWVPAAEKPDFSAPPADTVLQTLKRSHPRLIVDDAQLERIKHLTQTDPVAGRIYRTLKQEAERILKEKPSIYEIPDGRRLLSVSRRVVDRVRTLALVYRLERDSRYLQRAWAELEAAAKFPNWNPSHFLDTAEMTHAFAVGYDWLYPQWTGEQRRTLREAIVRMGLNEAMKVYQKKASWAVGENNWTQVCNGGIGTGALAIADEEPGLCAAILHEALQSIPRPMSYYAPDGAGTEGVTYWDYGSRYNVLFITALQSALGTDFGLASIPGFAESGDYQMYISGADRRSFNFGDCGTGVMSTPQHSWFGPRFQQPRHSWFRYHELTAGGKGGNELDLIWFDSSAKGFDITTLPLDKHFRKAEVASMRSSWTDPNALVLGIQAGNNSRSGHRHLDLGSFILEAQGERWIKDLGTEHETYMSHRHKYGRYDFYRCRAEGHNTLVLNPGPGKDQATDAKCPIVAFDSTPKLARAKIDLTAAYRTQAAKVERVFSLVDRSTVTVEDVIEAIKPSDLWWFAHTDAKIEISADGRTAMLQQHNKQLRAELVEPAQARFQSLSAKPLPTSPRPTIGADDSQQDKLAIHLSGTDKARVTVRFVPVKQ